MNTTPTSTPPAQFQNPQTAPMLFAALLYGLAYIAAVHLPGVLLLYLPLEHRWTFVKPGNAVAMGYMGVILFASIFWTIGYAAAHLPRLRERLNKSPVNRYLAGATTTVYALGLLHYLVRELAHWGWGHQH